MTEFTVDFNFRPEIMESASDAESQVGQILDEIKGELVGSSDLGTEAAALCRSEN